MKAPQILIIDSGSQYTLVIARTLREIGYRSVVLSSAKAAIWLTHHTPGAIILSGSDKSVYADDAPQPPEAVLISGVPVLGICYGMQWLAHALGGAVEHDEKSVEYGPADVELGENDLFDGISGERDVWASHGDSVTALPEGFSVIASDKDVDGSIRGFFSEEKKIWAVQFHPEVKHTACGAQLLTNFIQKIAGCEPDWQPGNIVSQLRSEISKDADVRALLGFSGGVDSTTMAAILAPALGDRVKGICIDGGHMRQTEMDEVRRHADAAGIRLEIIEVKDRFLEALAGVTDAEAKRAAFKKVYLEILSQASKDFNATHIVQGTLATDLIESGVTGGDLIKSHHNVGLDWGDLGELQPLSPFFKYEVRALAAELGLPDSVISREPFPGPGLFLRVFGGEVTDERLTIVRWADAKVREIIGGAEDAPEVSQLVVALCAVDTVGVKGDARAYGPAIIVRAVLTTDFMTASAVEFPVEIRREVTAALTAHPDIVRVWWDEVPKPPATTEFE